MYFEKENSKMHHKRKMSAFSLSPLMLFPILPCFSALVSQWIEARAREWWTGFLLVSLSNHLGLESRVLRHSLHKLYRLGTGEVKNSCSVIFCDLLRIVPSCSTNIRRKKLRICLKNLGLRATSCQ